MSKDSISSLFDSFAALLEYPAVEIAQQAQECLQQLKSAWPEAAERLGRFADGAEGHSLRRMQELYTSTFDMQPVCYPYIGFHLYGESYKRGAFMSQLNEAYRTLGYSPEQELPDHLPVALRFLGMDEANRKSEFCQALLNSGLVPALEKMLPSFGEQSENPYFWLLSALQQFLVQTPEKEFDHA